MKTLYLSLLALVSAQSLFADAISVPPGGDVTAASAFGADNVIIRSNGTGKGVQGSGISIDDSNNIVGVAGVQTESIQADTVTFVNAHTGTFAVPNTTTPLSPVWGGPTHTVWQGVTGTINLPPAAAYADRGIIVYNTGAFVITIDPNASEVVVRDGVVQTGGVSFTLSAGAGNYVALISDGVRWITLGFKGTLAVGS